MSLIAIVLIAGCTEQNIGSNQNSVDRFIGTWKGKSWIADSVVYYSFYQNSTLIVQGVDSNGKVVTTYPNYEFIYEVNQGSLKITDTKMPGANYAFYNYEFVGDNILELTETSHGMKQNFTKQ